MTEWMAKFLDSNFCNSGMIGKLKDYIYFNFVSNRLESKTDQYREEIIGHFMDIYGKEDWILAFGSFLKFYRDNTMDGQDIDILIYYDDFIKHKDQLKNLGYTISAEFHDCDGRTTEYKLMYKNVEIDIFFVFKSDKHFYYASSYKDSEKKDEIERNVVDGKRIIKGPGYMTVWTLLYDFEVTLYDFNGMKFKSYKHADENLTCSYGDWRTPDPNFDPLHDNLDSNITLVPNASAIYYLNSSTKY